MTLSVHVERVGDQFTITTIIPPRRAGVGPNLGAMQKALNLLTALNPDAFDPAPVKAEEVAHADGITASGAGLVPEGVAVALLRDTEQEDDTGEPYPDPRYAGVSCNIGGRCDD